MRHEMKQIHKKAAFLLAAVLFTVSVSSFTALAEETWQDALESTDNYLKDNSKADAWSVFARGRNPEADLTEDYYIEYYENLDVDSLTSSGDQAKALLALRASGRGESDKAKELRETLLDWDKNKEDLTGNPYAISTVIESLSGELSKAENADERQGLVESISSAAEKHFDLYGYGEDVDSTAMAAAALTTVAGTGSTVDSSVSWIGSLQDTDGNIKGAWGKSPETTAQAVVVLSELDKVDDPAFTKSGNTTVDGLMTFYDKSKKDDGGGFAGGYDPVIRAQQAEYALAAYARSQAEGAASLLDMSDVTEVYYLTYDGNGGSGSMKTQAVKAGQTGQLQANAFKNSGYRFAGWKDGSGKVYADRQTAAVSKDTGLYAIWEKTGSSSSGDSSSSVSARTQYLNNMRILSTDAVSGDWKLNDSGKWTFSVKGIPVRGSWVLAHRPDVWKNAAGWFYLDDSGEMLTGWQKIADSTGKENWFYLNTVPDAWYGACYMKTITPDGFRVGADGAWIDPVAKAMESELTMKASSSDDGEKDGRTISVSISVSGNTFSESGEIGLPKNSSAYDALKAFAKEMDWAVSGSGSYVKGINGENEKSAGALSGWTYSVNGETPNKSAGSLRLHDGDSVEWTFVDGPEL